MMALEVPPPHLNLLDLSPRSANHRAADYIGFMSGRLKSTAKPLEHQNSDAWAESEPFLALSGALLAEDWLTDEEDEAWKDLR